MARDVPVPAAAAGVTAARGEPGAVLLLAIAGFFSLCATRLCDAMLPALAQAFGTSTTEAAATISAYAIAYGVMQLVYGPLGDRFGKPRVIALASASCALSTVWAALAPSLEALVVARAAMGAGTAAIVPLSLAWIGDTVPLERRQQTLARYSSVTVIGMIVGPLVGGLLAQFLSWRFAFALLVPFFGVTALVLLLRPPVGTSKAAQHGSEPPLRYLETLGQQLAAPWSRLVLIAGLIEAGLAIASLAFVPTVLHTRFGLPLLHGGAIAALFGVGGFLFGRSAPLLLRRVRPAAMPGVAGVVLLVAFALLAWMPHWGYAAIGCTLAGFGFFTLHNTLQVQATQLSSRASGLALSLFSGCIFVGQSVGVIIGAVTFTRFAPAWSFGVAGLGLLLLGLMLMHLLRARANQGDPK